MKKIELLAPAGDFTKFKVAIEYGADAVYLSGENFGLRAASKNFSLEEIKEASEIAHKKNKKIYITLNVISHDKDLVNIDEYVQSLVNCNVDAFIVSDPGLFLKVKNISKDIDIHISTQANVTNSETAKFWALNGAKRIILARELSLEEISNIRNNLDENIELESFVHGAMCMAYSGRCLLSNYMTGRNANMGDCAHPCRYKYYLVEEKRPNEFFPIEEDAHGSYIMNSKDLCMINNIPDLIKSGINSLKIEGRVKSEYYVATVVKIYRQALDDFINNPLLYFSKVSDSTYINELKKVSHRHFTSGFYFGNPKDEGQTYENSSYIREYDFIAKILSYSKEKKFIKVEERNKFSVGDEVEIFGSNGDFINYTINKIFDKNLMEVEEANIPKEIFYLPLDIELQEGFIRRKVE